LRYQSLDKSLDRQIYLRIRNVIKNINEEYSGVEGLLPLNKNDVRDILDLIHERFIDSVVDALRFRGLEVSDKTISKFIDECNQIRTSDPYYLGMNLIDLQINDIVLFVIQNWNLKVWKQYYESKIGAPDNQTEVVKEKFREFSIIQRRLEDRINTRFNLEMNQKYAR
jgi:hypothetical protein